MADGGKDLATGIGLGFVAGFVDAVGFIGLSGLFTAHVTGNFVLIGFELVTKSNGIVAKLLALPAFIVAVAVTRLIAAALERRGREPLPWLLAGEAILLVAFCASGVALSPLGSPDGVVAVAVGLLGVGAMGCQNAITRLALSHLAATTVMTVNVTQAVIDAVDLSRGGEVGASARARLRRTLPPIFAFAAGALAGAFGIAALSFWCLTLPIVILSGLIVLRARRAA